MKNKKTKKIQNFDAFISPDHIGRLPVVYQSIKGIIRDEEDLKNMIKSNRVYMPKYGSEQSLSFPFYKNISKIYEK